MEYIPMIVQSIATIIFGIISFQVRKYLDETTKREKEIREAIAREREANTKGTQALLRDRLLQGFHFFRARGSVTYGEASSYKNMYEAYHGLGKNGVMDGVYESFKQIPILPDREVYPHERDEKSTRWDDL